MTLVVPEPVAAYLDAEAAKDADAISRCFAQDSAVRDEEREYRGRDAIRQWKTTADAKYNYVLVPLGVRAEGNRVTVRARIAGDFPGSPVELDYIFTLSNENRFTGDSIMTTAYPLIPSLFPAMNSRTSGFW